MDLGPPSRHAQRRALWQFAGLGALGLTVPLLLLALARPHDDYPLFRTPGRWNELLRSADPAVRVAAVHELAGLSISPPVSCSVLAERLGDAAPVRAEAIPLLAGLAMRSQCVPEVLGVLDTARDWRARRAAAQTMGAAGRSAGPAATPALLRSLDDVRVREAAIVALGRIATNDAAVLAALERVGRDATGETLADVNKALAALRTRPER